MQFLQSISLGGFLSFPPHSATIKLTPLNLVIGPNGSGKSNLIEAIEVLRAAPTALASLMREGGTPQEWLWKGEPPAKSADVEAVIVRSQKMPKIRYRMSFASVGQRMEVLDEVIEEAKKRSAINKDVLYFYRFQKGKPVLNVRSAASKSPKNGTGRQQEEANGYEPAPILGYSPRRLELQSLVPGESILSQRKDPEQYPEVSWLGKQFSEIQTFRDWTFGRSAPLRRPQQGDLPIDALLAASDNLGLILNELQHTDNSAEFNNLLARFLPRYERFSSRIQGNTVQFYLHEKGLTSPVPATRLSDGTIRFMAMLALLLSPTPPPLLCIEEPELGLHPDAILLFADLLADASSRMQLIVTTHSDALVSALTDHADSVLVCQHLGGTTFRRVEAKRIAHLLDRYRLGELWTMGELGGNS